MARETKTRSFVLRVDAATMDALESWAEDEFRSINGQLQWIIADALRRSGRLKRPRPAAPGAELPGNAGQRSGGTQSAAVQTGKHTGKQTGKQTGKPTAATMPTSNSVATLPDTAAPSPESAEPENLKRP